MNKPSFVTDQMQVVKSRMLWLRFVHVNFFAGGLLGIWLAERLAGAKSLPFSNWYFAFVVYTLYGFWAGIFIRRKMTRKLAQPNLVVEALIKRWQAREYVGMAMSLSPIFCFCFARIFLRMSVWFSIPWYVLGFLLLLLWRPSLPEALMRPRIT